MTEFWDKPAEKSGKVLAAFLEGLPLVGTASVLLAAVSAALLPPPSFSLA